MHMPSHAAAEGSRAGTGRSALLLLRARTPLLPHKVICRRTSSLKVR